MYLYLEQIYFEIIFSAWLFNLEKYSSYDAHNNWLCLLNVFTWLVNLFNIGQQSMCWKNKTSGLGQFYNPFLTLFVYKPGQVDVQLLTVYMFVYHSVICMKRSKIIWPSLLLLSYIQLSFFHIMLQLNLPTICLQAFMF